MSTYNLGFYGEVTKIIFQLSLKANLNYRQPIFMYCLGLISRTVFRYLVIYHIYISVTVTVSGIYGKIAGLYKIHVNIMVTEQLQNIQIASELMWCQSYGDFFLLNYSKTCRKWSPVLSRQPVNM